MAWKFLLGFRKVLKFAQGPLDRRHGMRRGKIFRRNVANETVGVVEDII